MSRGTLARVGALVCAALLPCVLFGPRLATCPAADGKDAPGKDVFGATKVWAVHLEIPAKEYDAMQPAGGGPGGPPAPLPRDAKEKRDGERNLFGTEFPFVQADFTADGTTYKKVAGRYAGDISYFSSARGLKRPLKVQFNKFAEQTFHGLTALHLHAMPLDPAKGREVLAYSVFRAAGVPAPRTAFAEVTLTVPGKLDKETLGLYAVVEDVDKAFLADRFPLPRRDVRPARAEKGRDRFAADAEAVGECRKGWSTT